MIKIISQYKGSGKTRSLIKLSHNSGSLIVCPTNKDCERIYNFSRDIGLLVKHPITFDEYLKIRFRGGKFLIDDLDRCLGFNVEVASLTMLTAEEQLNLNENLP
jgi:hypothetical protein